MTTENLKLKVEDLVVFVVKKCNELDVWFWVDSGFGLPLLLITAAVAIWAPSGSGWTPLINAVLILWVFYAVAYLVSFLLVVWSWRIVDRRTHDREILS